MRAIWVEQLSFPLAGRPVLGSLAMIHLVGHNYNAREIIQNIFSPLVGVISSPLADDACHRNNLSFVELLQPFAKLPNDAHFRDVSGTSVSIRGLRLNICDIDWRPPQTVLARKMLNEAVTMAHNDKTKFVTLSAGGELEVPTAEPWFEQWRETFLAVQFPADHEFTRHFLSCLIVLSSADPNIVETAQKLTQRVHQMQSVTPQKLPKWFANNVLNSYVVLHEGCHGDLSKSQQSYELLKSTFVDSKCFLVQINSVEGGVSAANAESSVPDYWAVYIRRQAKVDSSTDQLSGPKTPLDAVSAISMPAMQMSTLAEAAAAAQDSDVAILHPLSPVQEHATEAINSRFSISSESIASQTINPNVWAADLDVDAPHGACLNATDVENLRHFVQDYAVRALIPYVEHLVAILAEAITNKKGVSKSLLSATKRWFVTSKPGAGASNQNAVIYTHESAELQTRKLGDLYFMFGHYNLAFQAYHQAKRDFNADSAWQYYAGALEMAAVSAFMLGTANRKTYDYMEDAIVCYLSVCKLQQFATRATLLSMECLKTARLHGEVAKQLIRMTSEESDLRSALLLEQAAYSFLAAQPTMHRKYAFHIVLSGNRYSRAGQRKHAYRCYHQAYQVFQHRGWSLAEDHIQYTMAKQAYTLKRLEEASRSFAHLLRPDSQQSAAQQASFIKEYIQTQNELIKRNPEVGLLPHALPQVVQDSVRVLVSPSAPVVAHPYVAASNVDIKSDLSDEPLWQRIEEMIVSTAAANKPFVFKPSRSLFTKECPTAECPLAVQGEPIEIAATLVNPVRCSIIMTGMDVLWQLKLDNDETLSNECLYEHDSTSSPYKAAANAAIKTTRSQSLVLEERAEQCFLFKLTPKLTGLLTINGIVAQVGATADPEVDLLGSLHFETQRIRTPGKQTSQTLLDNKLVIRIAPPVPALSVSFTALPFDLVAGEIAHVTVLLRNSGITPIKDVLMGCDSPRWITLLDKADADVPLSILSSFKDLSNEKLIKDKEIRRQHVFRLLRKRDAEPALKAQECQSVAMCIQAPYQSGAFTLRLLFYYELPEGASNIKYRLVRHTWRFHVHECLRTDVTCVVSNSLTGELGLNVSLKNENQTHHALNAELCVHSLSLYCAQYRLNPGKFYLMNKMELTRGKFGDNCLSSTKSASFQCRLEALKTAEGNGATAHEILKARLSSMDIIQSLASEDNHTHGQSQLPALGEMFGFLAKHETVYFNASISSEEFNSAVERYDPHATVALSWAASIKQGAVQRTAYGQHFMQLHTLYENGRCPDDSTRPRFRPSSSANSGASSVSSGDKEQLQTQRICDFAQRQSTDQYGEEHEANTGDVDSGGDGDGGEYWESNDFVVGKRCLLEDESFALAVKG